MKYQGEWIATALSLRNFQRFQYGAVALLVILGTLHYVFREYLEPLQLHHVTQVFDVGREDSVPTAFSIINLLVSSVLLYALHSVSKFRCEKIARYWLYLCLVFLFLAIDESASIHERTDDLADLIGLANIDFPYNKWVFIGAIFSAVVFFVFIPFLLALPRRLAGLILLAGAIYVTGALGFEAVGGLMLKYGIAQDRMDFIYEMRRIVEEGLEMVGIAFFNCTLFAQLAPCTVGLQFTRQPE